MIPNALIRCSCDSKFSTYEEFSKHIKALNDFDLGATHDWLERSVRVTQHEMNTRGLRGFKAGDFEEGDRQ